MSGTTQQLPRIVQFLHITDSGEYGNDSCAHCGADGRYQQHFIVEGGKHMAAMAGCVQLFPISPVAKAAQKIAEKERAGKKLNGWDKKIMDAVQKCAAGEISESGAMFLIHAQEQDRSAWMAKKFGGRR